MKKTLILFLFFIATTSLSAQTDEISYQAIIIDPNIQEIPGVNIEGNILPSAEIAIRFTILNAANIEEFVEIHNTSTDQYGMINLMIGSVNSEDFTRISWDGQPKDLKVEIDFSGAATDFVDLSRQALTFVPYAYHRNIKATGTLSVDNATELNSELVVEGPTSLNSSLAVNNSNITNLSGILNVEGVTNLNNDLNVVGKTALNDSLSVNLSPSLFNGKITVEDTATFNGPTIFNAPATFVEINVNGPSNLNGQVTVSANMDSLGDDTNYNAYPLLVQGSPQGIAIKVNGSRTGVNNYVSFWDAETGEMWGRIEGQMVNDLLADPEYLYETASIAVDVAIATADVVIANVDIAVAIADLGISAVEAVQAGAELVAASTSTTACVGLGACATVPIPSFIISNTAKLVVAIANAVVVGANLALVIANAGVADASLVKTIADGAAFEAFIIANLGVTYQSGAGDYAEWLPKANPADMFLPGELVGVKNGFISKSTGGADKIMVISTNPIVLGNMPKETEEHNYEKIAFMGQVPVRVLGKVEAGDYILPTIFGGSLGKAVHPEEMKIYEYKKIVGVAWSEAEGEGINVVNVAVGLNSNDMSNVILAQEEKLDLLQQQINQTNALLSKLVPGFKEALMAESYIPLDTIYAPKVALGKVESNETVVLNGSIFLKPQIENIVYIKVSREQIKEGIELVKANYLETGKRLEEHPFWAKMKNEAGYEEEIMQFIEGKLEKTIHDQKMINQKLAK